MAASTEATPHKAFDTILTLDFGYECYHNPITALHVMLTISTARSTPICMSIPAETTPTRLPAIYLASHHNPANC